MNEPTANALLGIPSRSAEPLRPGLAYLPWLARLALMVAVALFVLQSLHTARLTTLGFDSWRPVAIAIVVWFVVLDLSIFFTRGVYGQRLLFLLPALQLTLALVIFPTLFGLVVAFTEWDLGSVKGMTFIGLRNFQNLFTDDIFIKALGNNFKYVLIGIPIQYMIAFGIALLLNQDIRAKKFFRVAFLLPFMMSPVAVGWMVGRSILDANRGVIPSLLESIGVRNVSFFDQALPAFLGMVAMDSWINIPFIMVMLLAGLQALPHEVFEAAQIDGASGPRRFWDITFPLMLPVSLTAIVLRIIFEFKLVDIVRVVTAGGPGGATDTVSLYIYREGVESTNIGYATAMAMVFLVVVLLVVSGFLLLTARRVGDTVY